MGVGFSTIFIQGRQRLWLFCWLYCTPHPFWKGVHSKRKEFAPMGSKFFPFRVEHVSEGSKLNFNRFVSPESVWILHKLKGLSPENTCFGYNFSRVIVSERVSITLLLWGLRSYRLWTCVNYPFVMRTASINCMHLALGDLHMLRIDFTHAQTNAG